MAGNGGKRAGAGRKPGSRTSKANLLARRKQAEVLEGDLSPLDVMMSNLRFWNTEVGLLEKEIRKIAPEGKSLLQLERTPVVANYFDARESLQTAAEKAAPFVHPRISPIESTGGGPRDLSKLTNAELDSLERISRKIAGAYGDPSGKTTA